MKLAILGSGPCALESTLYFHQLGAHVVCFSHENFAGAIRRLSEFDPKRALPLTWEEATTPWSRELLGLVLEDFSSAPTSENLMRYYYTPLVSWLKEQGLIRDVPVGRVHKRFLGPEESPVEGGRLRDLFRVVWTLNPEGSVRAMVQENEIFFKAMGNEAMQSLAAPIESFEDFDLVIEATGLYSRPCFMGPAGALAVNEFQLAQERNVFYSLEALSSWKTIHEKKNLLIVGSGELSAFYVTELVSWLESSQAHSLSLVTTETRPFEAFLKENYEKPLGQKLLKFLVQQDEDYQKRCDEYTQAVYEWRDLEDHEKVKRQSPKQPQRKFLLYPASNVTSLDYLTDREGLFVSTEQTSLRGGEEKLSTLNVDGILVATGHQKNSELPQHMHSEEPGYYQLKPKFEQGKGLAALSDKIKDIERDMMSFFSKA